MKLFHESWSKDFTLSMNQIKGVCPDWNSHRDDMIQIPELLLKMASFRHCNAIAIVCNEIRRAHKLAKRVTEQCSEVRGQGREVRSTDRTGPPPDRTGPIKGGGRERGRE